MADVSGRSVTGVAVDTLGTVFVAGQEHMTTDTGELIYRPIISKISTHASVGETWTDIRFQEGNSFSAIAAADIQTTAGVEHHIVAAGNYLGAENGGWITCRSTGKNANGEEIWETLDRFTDGSSYFSPEGVAVDREGNIYIVGNKKVVTKKSTSIRWLLRVIQPSIGAKKTIELPADGYARGIACDGTDVFIVGDNDDSWQVLKWSLKSQTATVWMNNYRYSSRYGSFAYGITVTPGGKLYVVGKAVFDSRSGEYGIVREGTTTNTNWNTISVFHFGKTQNITPLNVAVDTLGNVHVVGSAPFQDTPIVQWFSIRGSLSTSGWNWRLTDRFGFAANKSSQGRRIVAGAPDPDGSDYLFAVGGANDITGASRLWIVRRSPAPAP